MKKLEMIFLKNNWIKILMLIVIILFFSKYEVYGSEKKDILFNMFSLYAQRYILLDIWKEDAKESDSSKELLEKAQKLFAYSESEDDPRDKRAQEIYTDISDYLENQPMEFWETVDCRRGKLEDLLCEAYDKVYGK